MNREQLESSGVARFHSLKEQARAIESELTYLKEQFNTAWQEDSSPLVDHERGIMVVQRDKSKPAVIDLVTLAKDDPRAGEFLSEAARAGLLSVPLTAIRALKGKSEWADKMLAREMPGGVTTEIRVERVS